MNLIDVFVGGTPAAKQSFKYTRTGRAYQRKNVMNWQGVVGWKIKDIWKAEPVMNFLAVVLHFYMGKNIADVDNLTKAVLDGMQGIVYKNDKQVMELHVYKTIRKSDHGVQIIVNTYHEIEDPKLVKG